MEGTGTLRLDKLLWFLRLAPSRARAQLIAEAGLVRLNGRRIERAAAMVRAGDVLTLPWGQDSRSIRILLLPHRRGPAPEARACYEEAGGAALTAQAPPP